METSTKTPARLAAIRDYLFSRQQRLWTPDEHADYERYLEAEHERELGEAELEPEVPHRE